MKPVSLVLLLAAIGGFGALFYFVVIADTPNKDCPGHWHTTFAVYVPNPDGSPHRVDFATPRAANGRHYYDLQGGADMGMSMHMHQEGDERGEVAHGPAQWHLEQDGVCVSLRTALRGVEVQAESDSLRLHGAHAQVGEDKTWEESGDQVLRVWIEEDQGGYHYAWVEKDPGEALRHNLLDGERVLIAFGKYTEAQVKMMQDSFPVPISRRAPTEPTTSSPPATTGVPTQEVTTSSPTSNPTT